MVQDWIFQMINIYPVWERGIFGKGIRIRVNDEGMLLSPISLLFVPARIHNYAHTPNSLQAWIIGMASFKIDSIQHRPVQSLMFGLMRPLGPIAIMELS